MWPESAETIAEVRRFENEYVGNGQLHIVDADTGDLIARKDAYIPVNMFLDQDVADAEVTYWKRMAEQRRDRNMRYAKEMTRLSVRYDVRMIEPTGRSPLCMPYV
jgi:hypothetical protein